MAQERIHATQTPRERGSDDTLKWLGSLEKSQNQAAIKRSLSERETATKQVIGWHGDSRGFSRSWQAVVVHHWTQKIESSALEITNRCDSTSLSLSDGLSQSEHAWCLIDRILDQWELSVGGATRCICLSIYLNIYVPI